MDSSAKLTPATLRDRRHALGLSQQQFGHALGISANTVARWERGELRVANPRLVHLAVERLEHAQQANTPGESPEPARSPDGYATLRRNLPEPTSTLVGRRTEARTVRHLVAAHRLVTLTGTAGIGKTRLALETARQLNVRTNAVHGIELSGLPVGACVAQAVAVQLGIRQAVGRSILETLVDVLIDRQLILLLDNCEHLRDECAELVTAVLGTCRGVRVLATSRQPLGVPGEVTWRVCPLSLPTVADQGVDRLLRFEAIALFVARARAAEPSFVLTSANASSVAEACRQLDGLPLAIELAAARMPLLAPQQLVERLTDRFRLLKFDDARIPGRHRALEAALDWSYNLLSESERRLFERLATFSGGFSLEAAEAVCASDEVAADDIAELLGRLVDKSLVVVDSVTDAERRYRLLESVRQYSQQRLRANATAPHMAQRHADWMLSVVERFEVEFRGPRQSVWFNRINRDRDNLQAALAWCVAHAETERGLRLAGAVWRFWEVQGYFYDARDWFRRLLAQLPKARTRARAKALDAAGHLAILQGDQEAGLPLVDAGLQIARELDDAIALANGFHSLGLAAQYRHDFPTAERFHQQSLEFARLGNDRARAYVALYNLAVVAQKQGELARASDLHIASLALKHEAGDQWSIGYSLLNLGIVAWQSGDFTRGVAQIQAALRLRWELGDKPGIAACLQALAEGAASQGRAYRAARLFGAADEVLHTTGVRLLKTGQIDERARAAAARLELGAARFAAAYAAGRAASLQQVVLEALDAESTVEQRNADLAASLAPVLTARERQVAFMVSRGLTNREIAVELTIAVGTASRHVANILAKLGVRKRLKIAEWATAHGVAASG